MPALSPSVETTRQTKSQGSRELEVSSIIDKQLYSWHVQLPRNKRMQTDVAFRHAADAGR